ncbi:hemerythrin domain-containing protein [Streptomyces sp. NPDC001914]|uniref:hemerythrin domain-containing protein n=1 Tax=Streptomyces sp. NPDC001914 TaxID=3364623 RepID=UPI0036B6749C
MTTELNDTASVTETRLAHDVHRVATTLLAQAAIRPAVPLSALGQLRDFLVVNLRHHHETEDHDLWPQILAAAPEISRGLDSLTDEHHELDEALDRLAAAAVTAEPETEEKVRLQLQDAAIVVRDVVHSHLDHEEPVLFPALRAHVSPEAWTDFAQRVIATTPPVAGHLMIGFLDQVGTPAEVQQVLKGLPEPVHPLLPVMRSQAIADLRILQEGS